MPVLPKPLIFLALAPFVARGEAVDFNDHIQPILSEYCYQCHGPDSSTRTPKSEPLRLDREEFAFLPREGTDQAVIIKGDPEASDLIRRITTDDPDDIMPPPKAHKVMKPGEIALLKEWVKQGAPYEEHWAFIPPARPETPKVSADAQEWARNPIDLFVAAVQETNNLEHSPREDSHRLIRRLSLDLTGLPPRASDLTGWNGNTEAAIDEMLASPASAEHFARHWLDAARYADTHGIHFDNYRSIWPYRDWVIRAFRENMPFDQFTIEQIAGDLLPGATVDQRVATGFCRCMPTTGEGGSIDEEWEAIYAQERVDTTAAVWLGLTTNCASCHDHKFDPVSMRENYALTAFFRNTTMSAMDRNNAVHPPNLLVVRESDRSAWEQVGVTLAGLDSRIAQRTEAARVEFEQWLTTATPEALAVDTTGLSLHLPLNGDSEALQGTVDGAPRTWPAPGLQRRDGPLGPAPIVTGANIDLGDDLGEIAHGSQVSYGGYFYLEGNPNGPAIARMDIGNEYRGWDIWFEGDGRIGGHLIDAWDQKAFKSVTNEPISKGEWHHFMITFDGAGHPGSAQTLYLDGKEVAGTRSHKNPGESFATDVPLRLGARHPDARLGGGTVAMQDFRLYQRLLSPEEIALLADAPEISLILARAMGREAGPAQRDLLYRHYLALVDEPMRALQRERAGVLRQQKEIQDRATLTLVMQEKADAEPFAHVLERGDYRQKRDRVMPDVPAVLPPLPEGAPRSRLSLAKWLVDPANPLPARVTMNRLWYAFFGRGLVETTEDFGIMGARPSHPKLLDWLAVEFVESGWDLRHMARLIASSATYQQSARITKTHRESDPENVLLTRGPRYRIDAEQIRDLALASSGLLSPEIGGPSVKPYQPDGLWAAVAMPESDTKRYQRDSGKALYRRSLYTFWKRGSAPPSMTLFDAPTREITCLRRERTNTPLQAFVLMNDPQFVEASRKLAENALTAHPDFDQRLDHIYLALLARTPGPDEREIIRESIANIAPRYHDNPEAAQELVGIGESETSAKLPAPELATWTIVASQVLNLDETITK